MLLGFAPARIRIRNGSRSILRLRDLLASAWTIRLHLPTLLRYRGNQTTNPHQPPARAIQRLLSAQSRVRRFRGLANPGRPPTLLAQAGEARSPRLRLPLPSKFQVVLARLRSTNRRFSLRRHRRNLSWDCMKRFRARPDSFAVQIPATLRELPRKTNRWCWDNWSRQNRRSRQHRNAK